MNRLIFICILSFSFPCLAQVNTDSLWTVWNDQSQPDTNRLKAIYKIVWNIRNSNPDSAYKLAQMQFDLAKRTGNKI